MSHIHFVANPQDQKVAYTHPFNTFAPTCSHKTASQSDFKGILPKIRKSKKSQNAGHDYKTKGSLQIYTSGCLSSGSGVDIQDIYTYIYIYIYIYVHIYIHIHMYIYIYIYILDSFLGPYLGPGPRTHSGWRCYFRGICQKSVFEETRLLVHVSEKIRQWI